MVHEGDVHKPRGTLVGMSRQEMSLLLNRAGIEPKSRGTNISPPLETNEASAGGRGGDTPKHIQTKTGAHSRRSNLAQVILSNSF